MQKKELLLNMGYIECWILEFNRIWKKHRGDNLKIMFAQSNPILIQVYRR